MDVSARVNGADAPALRVRPRTVVLVLGGLAVLIDLASAGTQVVSRLADVGKIDLLDVGEETSVGTWFTSMLLLSGAALFALIAGLRRSAGDRLAVNWFLLSGFLLVLSLDEVATFHEHIGQAIRRVVPTDGLLYYSWVVPALAVVALMAIASIGLVRSLDPRSRRLIVAAAAIYVGGGAGFEMLSGLVEDQGVDSLPYVTLTHCEELLEMLGITLLIYTLLGLLAGDRGVVELQVSPTPPLPATERAQPAG